jgi:energy-coupling factor transporter ATP-binding protein EcfA2
MRGIFELYEKLGVKIKCDGIDGSGCTFQPKNGSYTYVFTAKHCLAADASQTSIPVHMIDIEDKAMSEFDVQDVFLHDTEDLALILVKRIADVPQIEATEIVPEQELTSYGFPNMLASQSNPAQRIKFDLNFIEKKKIIITSKEAQMTYYNEPSTNIRGMSGSGIFTEIGEKLLLAGIFTELREPHGAYQGFCGVRIGIINDLLRKAGCEEIELKKTPFAIFYKTPEPYFRRKLHPIIPENAIDEQLGTQDAVDVLKERKKIVILGAAGSGKTTELSRIAGFFAPQTEALCPNLFHLNLYVDQDVTALLQADWAQIKSKLLVILDGLDEVDSQTLDEVTRKIQWFIEKNPEVYVIVSCRSNFYRIGNTKSPGTLKQFSVYKLANLDEEQIVGYASRKLGEACEFLKSAKENEVYDLLGVPFYLIELIELYQDQKNHLPIGRAAVFESLLEKSFAWDTDHFSNRIEEYKRDIIKMAERLALSMEAMQKVHLSDDEFAEIIPDIDLRMLVKRFSWFENEHTHWSFKHRNFQEFLAARVLARQTLDSLKGFVTFGKATEIIPPAWANTVAFLIPLKNDTDTLKWVMKTNPDVILLSESECLTALDRFSIFKEIFKNYKEKQLFINLDKYNYRLLAQFASGRNTIIYLLDELREAQHFTVKYNAVSLLSVIEVSTELKDRTWAALMEYGISDTDTTVQSRTLIALGRLKLCDEARANQTVCRFVKSHDDNIRYGLYSFIIDGGFADIFIDVFLDGIQLVRRGDVCSKESRLLNEKWRLIEGLLDIQTVAAAEKIVHHFINHPQDFDELDMHHHRNSEEFGKQLVMIYSQDNSKLALIIQLFIALERNYPGDAAKIMECFVAQTGIVGIIFSRMMEESEEPRAVAGVLARIADEECVRLYVKAYEQNLVPEYEVREFHRQLYNNNQPLHKYFEALINHLPDEKNFCKTNECQNIWQYKFQEHFAMLFNKEKFIKEIQNVLGHIDSETVDSDSIWKLPRGITSELVNRLLADFVGQAPVIKERIIDNLLKLDWDFFCMNTVRKYLKNENEKIILSQEQTDWIVNWCEKNQCQVDFRQALQKGIGGEISTSKLAINLWYFMWKLNIRYPQETLLDMLSFAWHDAGESQGFEYIETLLDSQRMTQRVLENLATGIEHDAVFENHINYCKRRHIVEGLKYALTFIEETHRSLMARRAAMNAAKVLSNGLAPLEDAIYKVSEDIKWELIDLLLEAGSTFDFDSYFENILTNPDENMQFCAATYLIKLDNMAGLRFYHQWVHKKMRMPDSVHDMDCVTAVKTGEAIPLLFEMLELSYHQDFVHDRFESLTSIIMRALMSIVAQAPGTYDDIVQRTELFIQENSERYKNVNFLNAFLERLEQHYVTTNTAPPRMNELLERLKTISF